jgi:hypothetical protein
MTILWIVIGIVGVAAFGFILLNYRRQGAIERSDHVVPEDYD